MKQRLADFIADFLVENDITHMFSVTGGGAMYLNDAFGHKEGLECIYNHHEQACSMAAEAYARINNKIAAVCVTTGPGGINALTGVAGGFVDSIPMLIISGQVRYDTTVQGVGLNLRAVGDQEFEICKAASSMTKYAEMIVEPKKIKYCLQKALYIAKTGRPGPCWLDIPSNVQGAYIETDELEEFDIEEYNKTLPPPITKDVIDNVVSELKKAKRPVIYAGSAIRTCGGYDEFKKLIEKLKIPVVTAWNSIDLMPDTHPLYVGRAGIMGDRAGNFAVQNSDLVLAIGCRLSIRQVGYNWKTWARQAKKIVVDIDSEELKKPTVNADLKIWADAKEFMYKLNMYLQENAFDNSVWQQKCAMWKEKYPVVQAKHYEDVEGKANVYAFIKELSNMLNSNQITVVGNGSACVVGSHAYTIKENTRFIINSGMAAMGYDLPAAIGACFASDKEEIVLITGDGSIQMNLQELQTIIHHKLPIKIFVINNNGYHSIRQTQQNLFKGKLVGIGEESHDLSFPKLSKIAMAYGYPYYLVTSNTQIKNKCNEVLNLKGPVICEIVVSPTQKFEPKSSTKRLEDGTLVSPPLEDLAPFLSREELMDNMIIPLLEEN